PGDRRLRCGDPRCVVGEGGGGAQLRAVGGAAAAVLLARGVPVLPRPVRGRWRGVEGPREVPAAAGPEDADRAGEAAEQGRNRGGGSAGRGARLTARSTPDPRALPCAHPTHTLLGTLPGHPTHTLLGTLRTSPVLPGHTTHTPRPHAHSNTLSALEHGYRVVRM